MNKQELIEELEKLKSVAEFPYYETARRLIVEAIDLAKQLDEPKKVVVPKFVDEKIKSYDSALEMLANEYFDQSSEEVDSDKVACWIDENTETFLRACLDGYEIEKEPLYYVKLPVINWNDDSAELETEHAYLILDVTSEETQLSHTNREHGHWKARLTALDIKSIDERYWPFAVKVDGGE